MQLHCESQLNQNENTEIEEKQQISSQEYFCAQTTQNALKTWNEINGSMKLRHCQSKMPLTLLKTQTN